MVDYVKPFDTILTAKDGAQAVQLAAVEKPDLVLIDIQMPMMDGLEATRHIKTDAATKHIPVIALTAFAMAGDADKAREAGADDYLSKPVLIKALLGKVASFLGDGSDR